MKQENYSEYSARTVALMGQNAVDTLSGKHVAVFGVGGVGGYAVEALVRGGVGELTLIDFDAIAESNLNRQIIATIANVGESKVSEFEKRALSINSGVKIHPVPIRIDSSTIDGVSFDGFDYVVDAIDLVEGKLAIIKKAKSLGIPVISAMGAGNKLDPTKFEVKDISQTSVCPLARAVRLGLKKAGILKGVKAVFSKELPKASYSGEGDSKKRITGSVSFVPGVMGLIIAGEVIKDLTGVR